MEYRVFGIVMAVPTVLVAVIMTVLTYKEPKHFLPNLSIAFWIIANANWMIAEFYNLNTKGLSIYPFIAGLLMFAIFISKKLIERKKLD
ncbi:MAG: hypothetical protein IT245_08145 [Bacteroidia bacterium]|nr:hypothetical protein [Bacteroidia bacterium]